MLWTWGSARPALAVTYVSAPGVLNTAGETYLLTTDVSTAGAAFEIRADNVTFDLSGHKITYDTGGSSNRYGVYIAPGQDNAAVRNGEIEQGSTSGSHCPGVYAYRAEAPKVSGLTITVKGPYSHTIHLNGEDAPNRAGAEVTGCVLNNYATVSGENLGNAGVMNYHYDGTLISGNTFNKGQRGVYVSMSSGLEISGNNIYHQQVTKNPYALVSRYADNCSFHDNTILSANGRGILLDEGSVGWQLYANHIDLDMPIAGNWWPTVGIRIRYGARDNAVHDNTLILRGQGARGIWIGQEEWTPHVRGNRIERNVVTLTDTSPPSGSYSLVAIPLLVSRGCDPATNLIANNTLQSNERLIVFEQGDGWTITRPTLIKGPSPKSNYASVYSWGAAIDNVIRDAVLRNGAYLGDGAAPDNWGSGTNTYYVQYTLRVVARTAGGALVPGVNVTARDSTATQVFAGVTGADGTVSFPLTKERRQNGGVTAFTPHTIVVQQSGYPAHNYEVTMDHPQDLEVIVEGGGSSQITVSKTADKTEVAPGEIVTYTVSCENVSDSTATNVVIEDVLPIETAFVAGSATLNGAPISPDPVAGGVLSVGIGTLAPGETAVIRFQVRVL